MAGCVALTGAAGAVDFTLVVEDLCAIDFDLSGDCGRYGLVLLSKFVFIGIQVGAHSPRYRIVASDIVVTVNRLIVHFICRPEARVREVCIFLVSCLHTLLQTCVRLIVQIVGLLLFHCSVDAALLQMVDWRHALLKHHILLALVDRLVLRVRIETVHCQFVLAAFVLRLLLSVRADLRHILIIVVPVIVLLHLARPLDATMVDYTLRWLEVQFLLIWRVTNLLIVIAACAAIGSLSAHHRIFSSHHIIVRWVII